MLDFTEEEKLAQKAIRAWCAAKLEPAVGAMEAGEQLPYPLMRELMTTFGIGEMIRAGFAKAKDGQRDALGGKAGPLMAVLMMELSRVCPGFALAFAASLGLFGGAVMAKGSMEQKERWALPVLTLEKVGAWALTEPGAGSDAFGSMRTRARREPDGSWVLSGSKTFITNAPFADVFVIYARAGDDVRAFLVERGAA